MPHKPSLRLKQEVAETYRLAMIGGYFYLAGWLAVAVYGQAFIHSLVVAWGMTVLFLVLSTVRRLHRHYSGLMALRRQVSPVRRSAFRRDSSAQKSVAPEGAPTIFF